MISKAKLAEAHAQTAKLQMELVRAKAMNKSKMSRKRKRDESFCKEVAAMNLAGLKQQRYLMQMDETDSAPTSMGARFIALKQVNEATNGLEHKVGHALIKDTLSCVGENLMKLHRIQELPRGKLLRIVTYILDDQCMDDQNNPLSSNVFLTNFLCGNIKRVLRLKHATHMTLGQLYHYVARYNEWFKKNKMSDEFQLIQQHDLRQLLEYEEDNDSESTKCPRFSPVDIRNYFTSLI